MSRPSAISSGTNLDAHDPSNTQQLSSPMGAVAAGASTALAHSTNTNDAAQGFADGIDGGAVLKFHHAVGVRQSGGRMIDHVGDDSVVFLTGKHLAAVQQDAPQQPQRFILKSAKTTQIVTFCVSPNRKYLALSEKIAGVGGASQVNIYTQQTGSKVRSLEFKYLSKMPVVSMCFSTDNKYLATATSLPDVYVYLWQVDKARLIGMVDVPSEITRVTISPWAYWSLCTTGPVSIKLWRLQEKQLKAVDVLARRRDMTVVHGVGAAAMNEGDFTSANSTMMLSNTTASAAAAAAQQQQQQQSPLATMHFTSHAWFEDEKVAAVTGEGDLVIVDRAETRRIIKNVHGDNMGLFAVQALARGLLVAGEGGLLSLFERTNDASYVSHVRRITLAATSRVVEISISPKEDSAVCLHRNNAVTSLTVDALENRARSSEAALAAAGALMGATSQALPVGFHEDEVTCVDVCLQRPFVATGSLDRTIRVWNFNRRRIEFVKKFDEEVLALSLHPTGLRMLVGFKNTLRMFHVLAHDLHLCTEFPLKPCHEVRFSNGGGFFAAVVAHRVLVYNSYDATCVAQLTGHTVLVRSICWSANDQYITTADVNGIAFRWNVETQQREELDEMRKSSSYACVRSDDATGFTAVFGACRVSETGAASGGTGALIAAAVAGGSSGGAGGGLTEGEITIRALAPNQQPRIVRPGLSTSILPAQRRQHTSELAISVSAQTLFVGTPTGCLYLYRWPLQEGAKPYQIIEVHNGEVQYVILSKDERCLFSIGDDRTMYMFDVDAVIEGRSVTKRALNYAAYEDVCYVLHSDLDDRIREIHDLSVQLEDLLLSKQRDEAALVHRYEQAAAARGDDSRSQIEALKRQLDTTVRQREQAESALRDQAQQLEYTHAKAAEELEALYARRTEEATARYHALKAERDDLVVRYENKVFLLQQQHDAEHKRLEAAAAEVEQGLRNEIQALERQAREHASLADAALDQTILDYELMMDEATANHRSHLAKAEEELARAVNATSTGERDAERLRKEKSTLLQELRDRERHISDMEHAVDSKRRENESLRKEMAVRFESINAAEKKIQHLKKQTTELEKLRYVLTFKFNELKKEVAPKERQLDFMTSRVEEIDQELSRLASDKEALKQTLSRKDERVHVLNREVANLGHVMRDRDRVLDTMLRELADLVHKQDHRRLVYDLKDVISKYADKLAPRSGVALANFDQDVTTTTAAVSGSGASGASATPTAGGGAAPSTAAPVEFLRQREYLESQLAAARRQGRQQEHVLRQEALRGTAENTLLVREINELRHERKQLSTKCGLVEGQLKDARLSLQRATSTTPGVYASSPGGAASAPVTPLPHGRGGVHHLPPVGGSATPGATGSNISGAFGSGVAPSPAPGAVPLSGAAATGLRRAAGARAANGTTTGGRLVVGPTKAMGDLAARVDGARLGKILEEVERNNAEMQRQQAEIDALRGYVSELLDEAEERAASATPGLERGSGSTQHHSVIRQHLDQLDRSLPVNRSSK